MMPVKGWRIVYVDGSEFTDKDGTWAEAPPFGVAAVVYYHAQHPHLPQPYKTVDAGSDIYVWRGEGEQTGHKMGLWFDGTDFYRIMDYVEQSVTPEVD